MFKFTCLRTRFDFFCFVAKRHINESCDVYSTCDDNSRCTYYGNTGTCQCLDDHREVDGRCVKGMFMTRNVVISINIPVF